MKNSWRNCGFGWFAVLIIISCTSIRHYDSYLKDWLGKSPAELRKTWGTPRKIEILPDGGKIYEFAVENKEGLKQVDRRTGKTLPLFDCLTHFVVDSNDRILAWKYEGHDCQPPGK